MIGLLRFQRILPTLRYCGNRTLVVKQCTQKPKVIIGNVRMYMTRTSDKFESKLKLKDEVPDDFNLVYRGVMDNYIYLAKHSSTFLLIVGASILYEVFYSEGGPIQFPVKGSYGITAIKSYTQFFFMYSVFILFVILLRVWSNQYILRMYYNNQTQIYKAIKVGPYPGCGPRSVEFQAGTVIKSEKKHFIPWLDAQVKVNGKKLFFFDNGFKTNADYERMFAKM